MSDVTRRTLRLLDLLQSRSVWSGPELAGELGVTTRSVRRDIDRLRDLGYPVLASAGHGGGYQLGPGRSLPPLLLSGEEAVATAVALRVGAGSAVEGLGVEALRALAKLDQVMPRDLRGEVDAIAEAVEVQPWHGPGVGAEVLRLLATAIRDQVQVRFDYTTRDGREGPRRVEPIRVLVVDRRWYLFAWDLDREDWRTFRLDRITAARASTFRITSRPVPDPLTAVRESLGAGEHHRRCRLRFHTSAEELHRMIPDGVGTITPESEGTALLETRPGNLSWIALQSVMMPVEVEALSPPELLAEMRALSAKLVRAAGPGVGPVGSPRS